MNNAGRIAVAGLSFLGVSFALSAIIKPKKGTLPASQGAAQALINPVTGTITQQYYAGTHNGIDIGIPVGTELKAIADGTVSAVYNNSLGGNQVIIWHPDKQLYIGYAHLSKSKVTVGQTVKQGDIIALSGNTGYSTGPHLHFTVYSAGASQNPLNYFTFTA